MAEYSRFPYTESHQDPWRDLISRDAEKVFTPLSHPSVDPDLYFYPFVRDWYQLLRVPGSKDTDRLREITTETAERLRKAGFRIQERTTSFSLDPDTGYSSAGTEFSSEVDLTLYRLIHVPTDAVFHLASCRVEAPTYFRQKDSLSWGEAMEPEWGDWWIESAEQLQKYLHRFSKEEGGCVTFYQLKDECPEISPVLPPGTPIMRLPEALTALVELEWPLPIGDLIWRLLVVSSGFPWDKVMTFPEMLEKARPKSQLWKMVLRAGYCLENENWDCSCGVADLNELLGEEDAVGKDDDLEEGDLDDLD